jgi:hypothetical protein
MALHVDVVELTRLALVMHWCRSKTSQYGEEGKAVFYATRADYYPVRAVQEDWRQILDRSTGFRLLG